MAPSSPAKGPPKKNKRQNQGGNQLQQKASTVAEGTRIQITQILEQFRVSGAEVYKFEDNLSNHERAAVHMYCRKMGMKSKRSGLGQQRRVSVYKIKKGRSVKQKENLVSFRFSGEAQAALQVLFSKYPPNDAAPTVNKVVESSGKHNNLQSIRDDMFSKPAMTEVEIANKVESLAFKREKDPSLRKITEEKSKLPIASFKEAITSTVESNQVVLVCGETGCGKTTQVPSFLLDHAWSKGKACKIVCTQPRRISATSSETKMAMPHVLSAVAERIASERGETIGDSVGIAFSN